MKSSIELIDKYYETSDGEQLFTTEGYPEVFNLLKNAIRKLLTYKSKEIWLDGRVKTVSQNDVSKGFFTAVQQRLISTKIVIE